MKYLKQKNRIALMFLLALLVNFGIPRGMLFAAEPSTKGECVAVRLGAGGTCRSDCASSGEVKIGTCSDDSTNPLCCKKDLKVGDKCGGSDAGVCKEYGTTNQGCLSSETPSGECSSVSSKVTLTCCVQGSAPTDDVSCQKIGGTCKDDLGSSRNFGCSSSATASGKCTKNPGSSTEKTCCVGEAGTASTTNTSGTTSLNYTPLENLPGFDGQSGDFATYFGNLYKLALWIVGISALFMLVVGGFLYLSSAGNTSLLGTAKKTIYSALIGLVIALISWLLLDTINGDLTNLKLSGLKGAIGTSGAPGTTGSPSVGTGPGGSTTTGTYTHAEAVAALSAAGIGVKSSTGCLGKDAAGCTTLEQIPKSAIDNLIAIKKDCGCSFDVTGGTETVGHVSHGPGKPIVDVTQDTTLGNFLYFKAGGSGSATITKSPGYGIGKICVTTAWEKLSYSCGSYREKEAHFHLVF